MHGAEGDPTPSARAVLALQRCQQWLLVLRGISRHAQRTQRGCIYWISDAFLQSVLWLWPHFKLNFALFILLSSCQHKAASVTVTVPPWAAGHRLGAELWSLGSLNPMSQGSALSHPVPTQTKLYEVMLQDLSYREFAEPAKCFYASKLWHSDTENTHACTTEA